MKIKLLFFVTKPYSISIITPIEDFCKTQSNIQTAWFIVGDTEQKKIKSEVLESTKEVIKFDPDAIIVPGNVVPDFWPGIKVQIFHGLCEEKKGHYDITGFFDLYCTPGPAMTDRFTNLQKKYGTFLVQETGWPKLDEMSQILTLDESKSILGLDLAKKTILYAPTFSPKYTSAMDLYQEILNMQGNSWQWIIKFHDLESKNIIQQYESLSSGNFIIVNDSNIHPFMLASDILLTDTSSVAYEYLMLDRPLVTYRGIARLEKGINIILPDNLLGALTRSIEDPDEFKDSRKSYLADLHPYQDGLSSKRVIDAIENTLEAGDVNNLKKKPRNWFRKKLIRKIVPE